MEYVKVIDKKLPYELLESYIGILWTYKYDADRVRAHTKLFEAIGVKRYGEYDEDGDSIGDKYADVFSDFVCEAYCCCGLSVDRRGECRVCGETLTLQTSIEHLRKYLKLKKLLITE